MGPRMIFPTIGQPRSLRVALFAEVGRGRTAPAPLNERTPPASGPRMQQRSSWLERRVGNLIGFNGALPQPLPHDLSYFWIGSAVEASASRVSQQADSETLLSVEQERDFVWNPFCFRSVGEVLFDRLVNSVTILGFRAWKNSACKTCPLSGFSMPKGRFDKPLLVKILKTPSVVTPARLIHLTLFSRICWKTTFQW